MITSSGHVTIPEAAPAIAPQKLFTDELGKRVEKTAIDDGEVDAIWGWTAAAFPGDSAAADCDMLGAYFFVSLSLHVRSVIPSCE